MTKNLIYLLVFAFVFSFVSCDKDNDNGSDRSSVSVNTISTKWEILDSNSPYVSFEFNKDGSYIVVDKGFETNLRSSSAISKASLFNNSMRTVKTRSSESESNLSPIHFGTYQIEGSKIILSGFGLIEVISITTEEFTFSFTLEATGQKNNFVAGKSDEPVSSSSRTDMLCRTWVIEKLTTVGGEIIEMEDGMKGSIVLFSKAGTYLVLYGGEGGYAGLSEWKWANSQETKLYYSWANWADDWSDNIVAITDLKSTSLAIEEYGEIWHLRLKK